MIKPKNIDIIIQIGLKLLNVLHACNGIPIMKRLETLQKMIIEIVTVCTTDLVQARSVADWIFQAPKIPEP